MQMGAQIARLGTAVPVYEPHRTPDAGTVSVARDPGFVPIFDGALYQENRRRAALHHLEACVPGGRKFCCAWRRPNSQYRSLARCALGSLFGAR